MGDKAAVLSAHPNREDRHPGSLRIGDDRIKVPLMFLAVADEDQRVVLLAGFLEYLRSQPNRGSNVRPTPWHPFLVDLLHRFLDRRMVDGERRRKERGSRKSDQADPVVFKRFKKLIDDNFRLCHAIRLHILHPHAS
jgi:hypothetical protein